MWKMQSRHTVPLSACKDWETPRKSQGQHLSTDLNVLPARRSQSQCHVIWYICISILEGSLASIFSVKCLLCWVCHVNSIVMKRPDIEMSHVPVTLHSKSAGTDQRIFWISHICISWKLIVHWMTQVWECLNSKHDRSLPWVFFAA
jgi:hypothetical protein